MKSIQDKKAQIAGQIFIYVLALVIVAGIIVYGYSAIKNFGERGEEVEYITMKTDIDNAFKSIINDYGSIKRPQLHIPGKYKKVCFVDAEQNNMDSVEICSGATEEPILCSIWDTAGNDINIFFLPDGSDNFALLGRDKLEFDHATCGDNNNNKNYCCFEVVNNKIKLQVKGMGDAVEISKY